MSANGGAGLGLVGNTIADLLGPVNDGFNWEIVRQKYDPNPAGTALSIHFTDESGENNVETVHLGIAEGPELVILNGIDEDWDRIGSIVTYQDFGLRILDPDDPMTPEKARYTHRGVDIHPGEGHSRERVWLVCREVLNVVLQTIVWQREEAAKDAPAAVEGGDD